MLTALVTRDPEDLHPHDAVTLPEIAAVIAVVTNVTPDHQENPP